MPAPRHHIVAALQRIEAALPAHLESMRRRAPFLLTLVAPVLVVSLWLIHDIVSGLPSTSRLRGVSTMALVTTLYDVHDRPTFSIFQQRRLDVSLDEISPHLLHAIIAVEDQRFYDHNGVDLVRIVAAALNNLRAGRPVQGGSTLTQQLARQDFLPADKTFRRKLKEAVLAWRLEREFTKDQILEMYLNKVYFGDGLYGIEAASLGFFGKHARDLDVAESALLAGLVKSPSTSAPTVNLDRAIARRNVVLQAMRDTHAIDEDTYQQALRSRPRLADALRSEETYGGYFKEEVRKQLVQRFGWALVYQGGLKVYTTIDRDMQKEAEAEVARELSDIERRRLGADVRRGAQSDPLQAALVALDPVTGEVRAMVGGRDFDRSHFNRATQARRQVGSAFKPLVYAAALELGYTPATLIEGLNTPIQAAEGQWVPADREVGDAITMRSALRTSSNRAAVQMLQQVGIPAAVRYAQRLGVTGLPLVPSLALGSGEVTLLSMTAAYSAFANRGMTTTPALIRRVEDASGQVLYTAGAQQERAVSEATAFIMTSMLSDVISAGTAWRVRQVGFSLPAAGKTGTTNDLHDVWFIGFTPHLATGVWIGYDHPRAIVSRGSAGDLAAPLWGRFMALATRGDPPDRFRMPPTVGSATICRLSGKLATSGCEAAVVYGPDGTPSIQSFAYTEYFVRGTEPVSYCPLHQDEFNPTAITGALPVAPPTSTDQPAGQQPVAEPQPGAGP